MQIKDIFDKLELRGSVLIVQPIEEEAKEKKTDSGIVLPGNVKEEVQDLKRGLVLKAGTGHTNEMGVLIENPIKDNAVIIYSHGRRYKIDGVEFTHVHLDSVIAYKNGNN